MEDVIQWKFEQIGWVDETGLTPEGFYEFKIAVVMECADTLPGCSLPSGCRSPYWEQAGFDPQLSSVLHTPRSGMDILERH